MSEHDQPLPDFEHPPVVEIALGVQYARLPRLTTSSVAKFWLRVRDRFPNWEERRPLPPALEWFGLPQPPSVSFEVGFGPGVPPSRALFVDASGAGLLQLQQDRFVRNWRKVGAGEQYPRYPAIRAGFAESLDLLQSFVDDEDLGELVPNQCEVTYVNHIPAGEGWSSHSEAGEVLEPYGGGLSDEFLGRPESMDLNLRFVFSDDEGNPVGRLHVSSRSAFRNEDGLPMVILTLTARGRPAGQTRDAVLEWLDLGRVQVVRGFKSVTTPKMHRIWGVRDGS